MGILKIICPIHGSSYICANIVKFVFVKSTLFFCLFITSTTDNDRNLLLTVNKLQVPAADFFIFPTAGIIIIGTNFRYSERIYDNITILADCNSGINELNYIKNKTTTSEPVVFKIETQFN